MEAHQDPDLVNEESYAIGIAKNECDDNESRTELTNVTGTNMLKLNDHCLLDIFSCNSLTPMDLCSLAETCKRFKPIAECVFPKKFQIYATTKEEHIFMSLSSCSFYYVTVDDCERILKNFGSRLAKYWVREDAIMDLVAKYCDGAALEYLRVCDFGNFDEIAVKLKSILERVLKFSIRGTEFMDVKSAGIIRCDSLVELELDCSDCIVPFLSNNTFPKLRRLTVLYANDRVGEFLFAFLSRHRLNYLQISSAEFGWSELVHKIDESCKELKKLFIHFHGEEDTAHFPKLQNLTELEILEIDIYNEPIDGLISLLRELKSLKTLRLWGPNPEPHSSSQIFDILSQLPDFRKLILTEYQNQVDWSMLPKLKKLVFRFPKHEFCAADLQNIIKQLPILEELELGPLFKFALSENDFLAIVNIVQGRANVLTLTCRFNFDYDPEKCDENRKVKLVKYIE